MTLTPFELEHYFAPYEQTVPYLLCSSDCESLSIADLLAFEPESAAQFHNTWLGYTDYNGHPALQTAIASLYENIQPAQILVHTGAEEAIHNFLRALLAPGDHLIAHFPGYQAGWQVALDSGVQVSFWQARPEKGWALDLAELKKLLRPNTKAVIVNTPHNPTGWLMPSADFLELNELSMRHGFWLFSDEVYRLLEHQPSTRLPHAADINPRALSLGVMSKSFGLAGLRIGWIATQDVQVFQALCAAKDYTTICNPAPSEFLASLALRHAEKILQRNRQLIARNLALLQEFFNTQQDFFDWQAPIAGPIAFPRVRVGTADSLAERALQAGILFLPGRVYTPQYNMHFRIGFGRANFPQVLDQFQRLVSQTPTGA